MMSDSLVFVLHGEADEKAAAELAVALSPLHAFPAPLPENGDAGVRFGMGAVCVVLWTPQVNGSVAEVLAAVAGANGNVVVLRRDGAATPSEFARAGFVIVDSAGDTAAEAAVVQAAVSSIAQASEGAGRLAGGPAKLAAAPSGQPVRGSPRARKLALRSAVGLAATMAIASVVAPIVSPHAAVSGGDAADNDARADSSLPEFGPAESAAIEVEGAAAALEPLASEILPTEQSARVEPPLQALVAPAAVELASQVTPPAPPAVSIVETPPSDTQEQAPEPTVDPELAAPKVEPAGASHGAPTKGAKKEGSAAEQSQAGA